MLKGFIAFIGRLLLSVVFLAAGMQKILDWDATEHAVSTALVDWLSSGVGVGWLQQLIEIAMPLVPALVAGALICELLGGLCILLGIQVRFGAMLLILFIIPATLLMHHFWTMQGSQREIQQLLFVKNISILGGLLLLLAYGRGEKSPKKKHDSKE